MARLKTKGEVIPIRLPLVIDSEVRARAAERNESVSVFLGTWVARAWAGLGPEMQAKVEKRAAALSHTHEAVQPASNTRTTAPPYGYDTRQPRPRVPIPAATCSHANKTALTGGLARCVVCKRVRGADGVWR